MTSQRLDASPWQTREQRCCFWSRRSPFRKVESADPRQRFLLYSFFFFSGLGRWLSPPFAVRRLNDTEMVVVVVTCCYRRRCSFSCSYRWVRCWCYCCCCCCCCCCVVVFLLTAFVGFLFVSLLLLLFVFFFYCFSRFPFFFFFFFFSFFFFFFF